MFKTDKVLFYVFTPMPNPSLIRLKEPAIAGYVYNPPQTPPFDKGGACCCPGGNLPWVRGVERVERVSEVVCEIWASELSLL